MGAGEESRGGRRGCEQDTAGQKITPHTFWHSAARHWLANNVPIHVVSRWLGHSNLQTMLIYLEILPDPTGLMDEFP